jgi:hypothetical protein
VRHCYRVRLVVTTVHILLARLSVAFAFGRAHNWGHHEALLLLIALCPAFAQQLDLDGYLQILKITPGASIADQVKTLNGLGITLSPRGMQEPNNASRVTPPQSGGIYISPTPSQPTYPQYTSYGSPQLRSSDGQNKPLGSVNANPFDPNSVSNPFGQYGSQFSPDSVKNPFGPYGSPYSPYSSTNPYATQAPTIVAPDGKPLGKFSANPFDPNSTSNPFGRYGSPYSPDSIKNP